MLSPEFIVAGRATFIVENPQGESVTVQIRRSAPNKINPHTGQPYAPCLFVSVRHNNDAWAFIGKLGHLTDSVTRTIVPSPKTLQRPDWATLERSVTIANWALRQIREQKPVPTGYRIAHTGRCGKCGKMLRDAESIALGLGPVCRG